MKKILIPLAAVIVIIVLGSWVLNYLSTGVLQITGNDIGAEVSLLPTNPNQNQKLLTKGNISKRIKPGAYEVDVLQGEAQTRYTIIIKRLETTIIRVRLREPVSLQTLGRYSGQSFVSSDSGIKFLNLPASQLYTLDSAKATRYIPELYPIRQVHWLSAEEALVLQRDGDIYMVRGTSSEKILLPGMKVNEVGSNLGSITTNHSGQFCYLAGHTVYCASSLGERPKQLARLGSNYAIKLVLSDNGLLLIYQDLSIYSDEDTTAQTIEPALYELKTGRATKPSFIEQPFEYARFSPDSTKVLMVRGYQTVVHDISSGRDTTILATRANNSAGLTWVDNQRIIYSDAQIIWMHDLREGATHKLAEIEGSILDSDPFYADTPNKRLIFGSAGNGSYGSTGNIYSISY